jgi:hypothetical protein
MTEINRREFMRKAALAGLGVSALDSLGLPLTRGLALAETPTRATGPKWGIHANPRGTETIDKAVKNLEAAVGRSFAIERNYSGMNPGDDLPQPRDVVTDNQGRIPYRSFHAWSGTQGGTVSFIPWADIAAGRYDAWLTKQADSLRAWNRPMYICFHHEPENDGGAPPNGCGSGADYRAAFAHVRQVFGSNPNLTWVCTLMRPTFWGRFGGPSNWLPKAWSYDYLGIDAYNRGSLRPWGWRGFAELVDPAYDLARTLQKPLYIGEVGSVEEGGDKAQWITDAAARMKAYGSTLVAVCWSHVRERDGADFWLDTSAASLAAFKKAGLDPYFNG